MSKLDNSDDGLLEIIIIILLWIELHPSSDLIIWNQVKSEIIIIFCKREKFIIMS